MAVEAQEDGEIGDVDGMYDLFDPAPSWEGNGVLVVL